MRAVLVTRTARAVLSGHFAPSPSSARTLRNPTVLSDDGKNLAPRSKPAVTRPPPGGIWQLTARRFLLKRGVKSELRDMPMPTMSNLRRRKIQARQRKVENEKKRLAKIAKKERNAEKKTG